ncbi:alkaline phosphatase family protein [Fulvivirga sedimenti]|uniref:Alkaline phosphatase family protein n=1 Tax=Fulvivirga sedimenti TaxID=2879465 RepID=A0A9X1HLC9_9BACT|nr:nucleotide pyrophosphatase/phosphodiesterase family protein [Fulvivirga sedimenti]MCA6074293.1 alkaline phosphatase family protein [Fulvivirga sedimenti]
MKKTVVINAVGLSGRILGENTPFLNEWSRGRTTGFIETVLPAVTCSVQSTYLTGEYPQKHGIVGNGWYFKDECEVKLWRQSNKLVQAPKIWDEAREKDPSFTVANMFWWYNMYSTADYSVTPRPQYLADGRKQSDCYSHPASLRDELQSRLGTFPLFHFWGPTASIKSSKWIAEATKYVVEEKDPDLTLVYLPHLDYCLQKFGNSDQRSFREIRELDSLLSDFIPWLESKGRSVQIISEYGITNVSRPVDVNRVLRKAGYISVREERGTELLDAGASRAFALADHQIAHVYIKDPSDLGAIRTILEGVEGVEQVLDKKQQSAFHLDHDRSGDLVIVADKDSWFTYYYWLDDKKAPDFARTVDIHKKPGYDPAEMFMDPEKALVMPRVLLKVLGKKIGFRTLMNVIPLNPSMIRGSHGRIPEDNLDKAIFIGDMTKSDSFAPDQFKDILLSYMRS